MKYKIKYQENNIIKTKNINTKNIENEILPDNIIEIKKKFFTLEKDFNFLKRIKQKELNYIFYELSLMLDSKIELNEALDILIKNRTNSLSKDFLETIKNSFSNSMDIYKSLERFNINPLIKSFLKITQDSGNVSNNIKSLSIIINENYEIKKEFAQAMAYPMILFITFFLSLISMFKFVVPKFEFMFSQSSYELPFATKVLFLTKDIFENYLGYIFIVIMFIVFLCTYFYKNSFKLRYKIDKILVNNIYIISDIYQLKTLYTYFTIVDILLQSKYEIHESLVKAKILLDNLYLLDRITQIDNLLKSGNSITFAFTKVNIFDDITLSLIRTGEISNSLDLTIKDIKRVYKKRFDEKLKLFSLVIEPVFLLIIMSLVVWIILAIFVPIWSMGDILRA